MEVETVNTPDYQTERSDNHIRKTEHLFSYIDNKSVLVSLIHSQKITKTMNENLIILIIILLLIRETSKNK